MNAVDECVAGADHIRNVPSHQGIALSDPTYTFQVVTALLELHSH